MHSTGVNIVLEFRFYRDEKGQVYTDASFDYQFWQRYLMVFSHVNIIARAKPVSTAAVSDKWKMVTGDKVTFSMIPYYQGVGGLVRKMPTVLKEIIRISSLNKYPYIFRMPSIIGAMFFMTNKNMGTSPFGVEMVGDPEEVFGSLSAMYRPIGRAFVKNTRSIIARAKAVAYVERKTLPAKYPATTNNVFYFSSIDLPDSSIFQQPRSFSVSGELNIVSIGALDQMYKGPDLVLKAIEECKKNGLVVNLVWIGGGAFLERMKELSVSMGLKKQVTFTGMLTDRSKIEEALDKADMFVLASRTEGLPRAMIEAMARGLPCIGSNVGGIPQLLSEEYLFEKNNVQQLAQLMTAKGSDNAELAKMSQQNIETAKQYANSVLNKERIGFYNAVMN